MATEVTTLNEYQTESNRTARMDLPERERLATFALGLGGESGEVQDLIKKHLGHGHPLDLDKVKKELGDVLWYVSALAGALGFTLEAVARANVAKLMARYPDGFSVQKSLNRSQAEIQAEIDRRDRADADAISPGHDANGSPVAEPVPLPACDWRDDGIRWKCQTCGGSEPFGANKREPSKCKRVIP